MQRNILNRHSPNRTPCGRTRREFLWEAGGGFAGLALIDLLSRDGFFKKQAVAAESTVAESETKLMLASREPHFPTKVKHCIFLFMNGAPSHVDTFDPKPLLTKYDGKPYSGQLKVGSNDRPIGYLMRSPFEFKRHGKSGLPISSLFPHTAQHADDICVIRSMHTDIPNHEPSLLMMNTGHIQPGRPSLGSWLTYGLGTENENLPGFVVLCPEQPTVIGPPLWSNAWLPAIHQGTFISDKIPRLEDDFDPYALIPNIHNDEFELDDQRREVDLVERLNRLHLERL
ncbi:MAG: DUF1501 domain-containing protein, partial [Planctomycetes bacterium]|nr:DUF1501 domain-containing protein [Planctomycetota bacterium]